MKIVSLEVQNVKRVKAVMSMRGGDRDNEFDIDLDFRKHQ